MVRARAVNATTPAQRISAIIWVVGLAGWPLVDEGGRDVLASSGLEKVGPDGAIISAQGPALTTQLGHVAAQARRSRP